MARKQKKKGVADSIKEEVKLELTPMIDVTFLILIFFMCTLKFKTLEGKLVSYLPTDKGLSSAPEDVPVEDAEIILVVPRSDGNRDRPPQEREVVFLHRGSNTPLGRCLGMTIKKGDEKNPIFHFDPPDTFEKVKKYLEDVRAASEESKAKINAYPGTPHIYVVKILNMMVEAKFTDISYSGIPQQLEELLVTGAIK